LQRECPSLARTRMQSGSINNMAGRILQVLQSSNEAPTSTANQVVEEQPVAAQCGRLWVLMSLGRRWTTRIIVLPGASLVASGPYRMLNHPNYFFVTAEMVIVPLALWMPIRAAD
jgi:isoprenylcysteine carboxyl methyltransferase (ICMT) family protein YpbQ